MKLTSPAFPRNRDPILGVLSATWTVSARILEIASGPGQHACYFANALPHLSWQPSDRDPRLLQSIDAWSADVPSVTTALHLDVDTGPWPAGPFSGALAVNFFHMVGPRSVQNTIEGVARLLTPGGQLVVYDCFTYDGIHVSPSNARFDARLKNSTEAGRVHAFEEVDAFAADVGLINPVVHQLPANNQCVVWTRAAQNVE
ncbi:MAG: DUF938 domain-containing protein [Myxococcota bacterium]